MFCSKQVYRLGTFFYITHMCLRAIAVQSKETIWYVHADYNDPSHAFPLSSSPTVSLRSSQVT